MKGKIALFATLLIAGITFVGASIFLHRLPLVPAVNTEASVIGAPQNLTTDTWGIFDPSTGTVLIGNNIDTAHSIASVSKLFTAEAIVMSQKKDDAFLVVASDVRTEGRAGKLSVGDTVTPYQLLFPLLIESSNDAAEAARRSLGDEYTTNIAHLIEVLRLKNTKLHDASGLSSGNISTVTDLATFFAHLQKTYPHILDITQLHTYIGTNAGYINNNPARSLKGFFGGKHGYTPEAKHTFIGTFTINDSEEAIGIIVLDSDKLLSDIQALLTYSKEFKSASDIMSP